MVFKVLQSMVSYVSWADEYECFDAATVLFYVCVSVDGDPVHMHEEESFCV